MKYIKKLMAIILITASLMSLGSTAFAVDIANEDITTASTKSKAIVIIPGILGSSLETTSGTHVWLDIFNYGKMALSETGTSVNSIRSANYDNYGANNTYKTLYDSLQSAFGSQFDIIFFDYDFRLSNTTSATKLENELSGYSEVVLVAHSMGGLVAGKYLANKSSNRSKTSAFISLGTPYVGAAKCIDVMETGEMLTYNFAGINVDLFKGTIKEMSKNCFAAYQLLPTSKYYSITGTYPLSVNGSNYSIIKTPLGKTSWGKKSDGTVKPMFNTAETFHSSLFNGSTHITDYSDVTAYTLAGTGVDTISKVSLNSNYEITAVTYSNTGDGTVLQKSAGYGTPSYIYSGATHMGLVSDSTVISRIKKIITAETGVSAARIISNEVSSDVNAPVYNTESFEIDPNELTINDRGWIEGLDNRRINIYADHASTILVDGFITTEENNQVYDHAGNKIGSVWTLGSTGRKMYALNNGEYNVQGNGIVTIEYMNNGYFERAVEYDSGTDAMSIIIGDYATQAVSCTARDERMNEIIELSPSYEYSNSDLMELNSN